MSCGYLFVALSWGAWHGVDIPAPQEELLQVRYLYGISAAAHGNWASSFLISTLLIILNMASVTSWL